MLASMSDFVWEREQWRCVFSEMPILHVEAGSFSREVRARVRGEILGSADLTMEEVVGLEQLENVAVRGLEDPSRRVEP